MKDVVAAMKAGGTMGRILHLHAEDNCAVALENIRRGMVLDGTSLTAQEDIALGHKVALRDLSPGDKVIKYGAPIGSVTQPVRAGAHLHVHNLKSDYIAGHCRPSVMNAGAGVGKGEA